MAVQEQVPVRRVVRTHDFSKPFGKRRNIIYWSMTAIYATLTCTFLPLIYFGVMPMKPSHLFYAAGVCFPIIISMVVSWWDEPGEHRTTLEKAYEFMIVWFPLTFSSQIVWELPWVILDGMGLMNVTESDRWSFLWWFYGVVDTRYITSDAGLFGQEVVAVCGGITMCVAWFLLAKFKVTERTRIGMLWICFFVLAMMLAVFTIYYVSEARAGFASIDGNAFEVGLILIFMNIPWLVAPIVSVWFIPKILAYLYGVRALESGHAEYNDPDPSSAGAKS